jgi:hypothetical protein
MTEQGALPPRRVPRLTPEIFISRRREEDLLGSTHKEAASGASSPWAVIGVPVRTARSRYAHSG